MNHQLIVISLPTVATKSVHVKLLRTDVGSGEPQDLASEVDIAPGETAAVALFEGGVLVIAGKQP